MDVIRKISRGINHRLRAVLSSLKNVAHAKTQPSCRTAETCNLLARSLLNQSKFDEAAKAAKSAISLVPACAEAHHTLARCLIEKDQLSEAVIEAQAAIDLSPEYAEAHFTLGKIFYDLKRKEEAAASFRSALLIKADYVEAMHHLGLVVEENGCFTEAEKLYRQAISLNPNYPNPYNNLGFLLRKMGRSAEASASFKIAYELMNPHFVFHQPASRIGQIFDIAKRYLSVLIDFAWWGVTGRTRPGAWVKYQLLNQATNGVSSNRFHTLLRKLPGKSCESLPEWRKSAIFPWIGSDDVNKIIETLDRDGLYVFDQLLSADLLDEMLKYAKTTEAKLRGPFANKTTRSAVFDSTAPLAAGYDFDEIDMMQQPVFQQFMGDPLLLAIAQGYLGVQPKVRSIYLWWNTVFPINPSSNMAQLFHNDISNIRFLKIFVYLTDVTEGTGPHSYVLGSHKSTDESKELRRRGVVEVSDEDILNVYGQERIMDLTGLRGTVFIADTRGFHKANLPQVDHRLVLLLYLVNSLYPCNKTNQKRKILPIDSTLIETVKRHPQMFAAYDVLDD